MTRQSREIYITGNVAVDRILNKIGERMDIMEGIRPDLADGYLYISDKTITSSTAPQETAGILGTVKQITVTDNVDGTVTLSTPQAIDISADVEFDTVKLGDATASRMMSTNADKKIVSIASLSAWIAGTADQIEVSNDGDGSITLSIPGSFLTGAFLGTTNQIIVTDSGGGTVTVSTPQDIDTDADVTFDTLILDQLKIVLDDGKIYLGTGDDASLYYDGTNFNIKTDEVAASDLDLTCGANKTLELQNVVYDDWYFEIAPKTTGAGKPTLASFSGNINQWTMAVNDIAELRPVEMAHKWKEATEIELHVHWATNGLDATDRGVKWEIDYTWSNGLGEAAPTAFAAATTLSTETLIPASTPDKTYMYTSVLSFTPTAGVIGAGLLMSLKRIASVTNPTPANSPWVIMVGVHYQINTIGSRQIGTK